MKYRYRQEWREKYVSLEEIAEWTRTGKHEHRVNAVRGLEDASTGIGLATGPIAAEWLPRVLPAKGEKGVYTGLVLLSLRLGEGGQDVLERLRRQVNVWPQTLLSFVGSSGRSLKVVIAYRLTGGGLPAEERDVTLFQQVAYRSAAAFAQNATGMQPEEVAHDGSESFRLSADPLVYLNPAVTPIEIDQPKGPLGDIAGTAAETAEVTLDTKVLPGYSRREMDVLRYHAVCRDLAFDEELPLEEHLMRLAVECRKAGVDEELAVKLTLDALDCYDRELMVRSTFETAYRKHKRGTKNPLERSMMHQILLEEFLRRRYMFRRNRVTGEVEMQEKHRYQLWWKPLTREVMNDLNNAAIREGIKVWPRDLERVLVSERIPTYDPVREWLEQLPEWDGRDRLGELADRVSTRDAAWRENFKIWMRSMVSQWRSGANTMYGAQMVLMLVGEQGTRKSTFMRLLLPRELMAFYIDRIDFANKKEALRALSRFLLINIDEYDQISRAQTAFLKHLIQRTDVKERKLYSTTFEQQQRYAAFCATTNSLTPLKDESGSRRYLVVEVDGPIDVNTQGDRQIDYRQLYAQIVHEIDAGEEYAFTGERERRIQKQNSDYYDTPTVVALFEDRFRKPRAGEDVLLMSPTEMLKELRLDVGNRSNATILGSYLRRSGYAKGEGAERRRYKVALVGK